MQQPGSPSGGGGGAAGARNPMDDIQRAVLVSMDPGQSQQHKHQALQYLSSVRASPEGWQLGLRKLHELAQAPVASDVVKFWCMDAVLYALQHRYEGMAEDQRSLLRRGVMVFIRDVLPAGRQTKIVKTKLGVILCNLLQHDYPQRWPSFWRDLIALLEKGPELMDFFLRFLGSFHDLVLAYDPAHTPEQVRRNVLVKDAMRDSQSVGLILEALRNIVIACRQRAPPLAREALSQLSDQIGWVDTGLILGNDRFIPLLLECLKDPQLQCGAVDCLEELVYRKALPLEKLALIKRLRVLELVASVDVQAASLEFCRELASLVGQTGSVLVSTYRVVSDPERLLRAANAGANGPVAQPQQMGMDPAAEDPLGDPNASLEMLQQACQASAQMLDQALRLALGFLGHPKPLVAQEVVEFLLQYVNNGLKPAPGSAVYEAEREKRQKLWGDGGDQLGNGNGNGMNGINGNNGNGNGNGLPPAIASVCNLVSLQRPEHINYFRRLLQLIARGIRYPRGFHGGAGEASEDDHQGGQDGGGGDDDEGDSDGEDQDDDERQRFVEFREQLLKLHGNMAVCVPQAVVKAACDQLLAVLGAPGSNPEVLDALGMSRRESLRQHDPLEIEAVLVIFYHLGQLLPQIMGRLAEDPMKTALACLIRSELSGYPGSPLLSKLYFKTVLRYSRFLDAFPDEYLRPVVISFADQRGLLHPHPAVRGRVCYLLMRLVGGIAPPTRRKVLPFLNDFLGHIYKVIEPVVSNPHASGSSASIPNAASPSKSSNESLGGAGGGGGGGSAAGGAGAGGELVSFDDVLYLCEVMGLLIGSQVTGQDCRKYVSVALGHFSKPLQQALANQRAWLPGNSRAVTERLAQLITAMGSLSKQLTKDGLRHFPDLLHQNTRGVVELYLLVAHPQHPGRSRDEPVLRKAVLFFLHRMVDCLREEALQHLPRVLDTLLRSSALAMQAGINSGRNGGNNNNDGAPPPVDSASTGIIPVLQLINQVVSTMGALAAPLVHQIFGTVLQQSVGCLRCYDYVDDPEVLQQLQSQLNTAGGARISPGVAGGEASGDSAVKEAPAHPYSAAIADRAYLQGVLLQFVNHCAQPGVLAALTTAPVVGQAAGGGAGGAGQAPHQQQQQQQSSVQPLLMLLLSLAVHTSQQQQHLQPAAHDGFSASSSVSFNPASAAGDGQSAAGAASVGGGAAPGVRMFSTGSVKVSKLALQALRNLLEGWLTPVAWHAPWLQRHRSVLSPPKPPRGAAGGKPERDRGSSQQQKTALQLAQGVKRSADAAAEWAATSGGDYTARCHPSPPPMELLRQALPNLVGRLLQHLLDPVFDPEDSEYRLCLTHIAGILAALATGFGDSLLQGCQALLRGKLPDAELGALLHGLRAQNPENLRKVLVQLKQHQREAMQQHRLKR